MANQFDIDSPEPEPPRDRTAMWLGICCMFLAVTLSVIVLFTALPDQKMPMILGILTVIPTLYAALLGAIATFEGNRIARETMRSSARNTRKLERIDHEVVGVREVADKTHDTTNSKMDEMLKLTGEAKHAEGFEKGRERGQADEQIQGAAVAAALATPAGVQVPAASLGGQDAVVVTGESLSVDGPRGTP